MCRLKMLREIKPMKYKNALTHKNLYDWVTVESHTWSVTLVVFHMYSKEVSGGGRQICSPKVGLFRSHKQF